MFLTAARNGGSRALHLIRLSPTAGRVDCVVSHAEGRDARRERGWLFGGGSCTVQDADGGADVYVERGPVVGVAGHAGDVGGVELHVNRAVVQNTCRRLCQVHVPVPPASRHPASR
jgi:hypothetical protein